jgi:hypothetical protein
MSMKKLLERIDSIEKTQKTTLTESVDQGMAEAKKPRKSYPTPSYLRPMVNAFDEMMEGGADYVTAVLSLSDEFRMDPDTIDSLLRSYTPDGWALPKLSKRDLLSLKDQDVMEGKKPDFLDFDKDGNKKEPMTKALQDKKKMKKVKEGQIEKTATGIRHRGTHDFDVGQEDGQADEKKASAKKPQHTYDAPFGTTKIPDWKGPKTVHKISDVEPGQKSDGEVRRRGRPKKVTEMTDREFHGFMRGIMVLEEKMSPPQKAEKERIVKGMKKKAVPGLKKRYGERWQDVMHATATKMAMESVGSKKK